MKFDPITIVVAIIALIAACVSFLVWLIYENFIKTDNRTIKHKYEPKIPSNEEYDTMYKNLDNRMTKLEDSTNKIIKDIDLIKRKLNMQ